MHSCQKKKKKKQLTLEADKAVLAAQDELRAVDDLKDKLGSRVAVGAVRLHAAVGLDRHGLAVGPDKGDTVVLPLHRELGCRGLVLALGVDRAVSTHAPVVGLAGLEADLAVGVQLQLLRCNKKKSKKKKKQKKSVISLRFG